MARKLRITEIVRDGDWSAFNLMLLHRSTSLDRAVAWLKAHGYKASRKAVWNYKNSLRKWREMTLQDQPAQRRQIAACAATLTGHELGMLATFAAFLASQNAKQASNRKGFKRSSKAA